MKSLHFLLALLLTTALPSPAGAAVKFDERGITHIDGKPFLPVGIYLYDFNSDILFFSYWPQGGRTWTEAGVLARELHPLTPFRVAPGEEIPAPSSDKAVHTRGIKVGKSGIVIAVNTDQTFRSATLRLPKVGAARLDLPFENRTIPVKDQTFTDRFMPYEVHVYQWGETPSSG